MCNLIFGGPPHQLWGDSRSCWELSRIKEFGNEKELSNLKRGNLLAISHSCRPGDLKILYEYLVKAVDEPTIRLTEIREQEEEGWRKKKNKARDN